MDLISKISGVEFCYFFICKTQFWYFTHGLIKSDEDENVKIGRLVHENRYKREKREKELFRSKFDVVRLGNEYVIYEVKKGVILEQNIMQLKFYMYEIYKTTGLIAKGIITSPGNRKILTLSEKDIKEIEESLREIEKLKYQKDPPQPIKRDICKKCAYRTFCFGDEGE
ncbi:MAG: CRISPR-associated protein Cas4 [Candidatus Anstonellaceae archaeon]